MKTLQPDASHVTLLSDGGHELVGRQDAVVPDQTADLHPKRNESDQINQSERAEKNPAREKIIRQLDVPAPEPAREPGEKGPVPGDKPVGTLGDLRDDRGIFISAQQPFVF